jgi:biotin carboxyl carrier protein
VRQVVVTRTRGLVAVEIDGRTRHVDAARIDAQTLSLLLDGVQVEDVMVSPDPATGQFLVRVGAALIPVALNGRRRSLRRDESMAAGSGPQRVVAPMPGKIVRVLVRAGDTVLARQPVVVVEAMKMENELRAARAGTVAEIQAKEGASVDAGALLVVIQ